MRYTNFEEEIDINGRDHWEIIVGVVLFLGILLALVW
jgi:hypothetical protein